MIIQTSRWCHNCLQVSSSLPRLLINLPCCFNPVCSPPRQTWRGHTTGRAQDSERTLLSMTQRERGNKCDKIVLLSHFFFFFFFCNQICFLCFLLLMHHMINQCERCFQPLYWRTFLGWSLNYWRMKMVVGGVCLTWWSYCYNIYTCSTIAIWFLTPSQPRRYTDWKWSGWLLYVQTDQYTIYGKHNGLFFFFSRAIQRALFC